MFEFEEYKQLVLELLWDGYHINRFVCELRLTLFVSALKVAQTRPQCLMPFPHYFFDNKTKIKNIDSLSEHINSLPPLDDIKEETEFPRLTWQLLYWVFTNPLNIKPLTDTDNSEFVIDRLDRLNQETKLTIPRFKHKKFASHFEIITSHPKDTFTEGKKKFGTFFAYHGSKLENFHSIIHRGLLSDLNERSAFGHGTYLTLNFNVAFRFAKASELWKHTQLKPASMCPKPRMRCIAIVEVVDDPSIKWPKVINDQASSAAQSTDDLWLHRKGSYCCVVDSDHLMQLRYLIVLF